MLNDVGSFCPTSQNTDDQSSALFRFLLPVPNFDKNSIIMTE